MNKPTPPKAGKTLAQFLNELESQNKTLADWARESQLDVPMVYAVARGRAKGRRGAARQILSAMGVTLPPMFRIPRAMV